MNKRVRLISLNGELTFECNMVTDSEAVIFCNRVFLRSFTHGTWEHFREVNAERVRALDVAQAVDTSIPSTTNGDNQQCQHETH